MSMLYYSRLTQLKEDKYQRIFKRSYKITLASAPLTLVGISGLSAVNLTDSASKSIYANYLPWLLLACVLPVVIGVLFIRRELFFQLLDRQRADADQKFAEIANALKENKS